MACQSGNVVVSIIDEAKGPEARTYTGPTSKALGPMSNSTADACSAPNAAVHIQSPHAGRPASRDQLPGNGEPKMSNLVVLDFDGMQTADDADFDAWAAGEQPCL